MASFSSPSKRRRAPLDDENGSPMNNILLGETPSKVARNTPEPEPRLNDNDAPEEEFQEPRPNENNVSSAALVTVTPSSRQQQKQSSHSKLQNPNVRRNLLPRETAVTPSAPRNDSTNTIHAIITPSKENDKPAKRRLMFGRLVEEIPIRPNTKLVYSLVKKLTGSIGGNGSCGPIYGELTMGSMQRMVNLMKEHTNLDTRSRFIDVGSGIGKPNLHVTQDPGVAFSCGIEMELDRWRLGLKCLQKVLNEASMQDEATVGEDERILHNCMMIHGNIMQAKTFDPFTHVYMFSIGFPPALWVYLSEAWNRSRSPYMICFHGPRSIIDTYEFDVELLAQMPTSMHGSKEGHMGYIYQRKGIEKGYADAYVTNASCDPVFQKSYDQVKSGLNCLRGAVDMTVDETWSAQRSMTRSEARQRGVVLSKTTDN